LAFKSLAFIDKNPLWVYSYGSGGNMQSRFTSLRHIGAFLKFAGVISLVLGLIILIVAPLALSTADSVISQMVYSAAHPGSGLLIGIFTGVLLFFLFAAVGVLLFALGECCRVLVAIEENTHTNPTTLKTEKDR
jgi:hypothetical protein